MKALKITTRETDKLRDEIKELDRLIGLQESYANPHNTRGLEVKEARRIETISALSALIDAKSAAINAALDKVNGKAVAHTINTYAEVWAIADRAEQLLDARGVTKGRRAGTTVTYGPSGPSASSYKYAAISTTIHLKRVADGWRLVGVNRSSVWPKGSETFSLTVSAGAAADIYRAAFEGVVVRAAEEATA